MEQGVMRLLFHFPPPPRWWHVRNLRRGCVDVGSSVRSQRKQCILIASVPERLLLLFPMPWRNTAKLIQRPRSKVQQFLWLIWLQVIQDMFINMKQNPKHTPNFRNVFTLFKTLLAFMESFPSFYKEKSSLAFFKSPYFHDIARFKLGWVCALVLLGGSLA